MPRIVQVAHTVPVEVFVDFDEGTVDRVVVCDEEVRVDEATGVRSEGFLAAVDSDTAPRGRDRRLPAPPPLGPQGLAAVGVRLLIQRRRGGER